MAAEQTTRPGSGFSPEAQARRQRKAERAERFKAAALDALDVGRGYTAGEGASRVLDGAEELATRRATAAVELGRPLRPNERRQIRRETLEQGQQQQRRRPTIDEYLERLTQRQRDEIDQSAWFQNLDERHQADVHRRLAVLEQIEEEAEYRVARDLEEQALLEEEDQDESSAWDESDDDFEERLGEARADQLEAEGEAVFGAWAEPMSVEEAFGLPASAHEPSLSEQAGWEEEAE